MGLKEESIVDQARLSIPPEGINMKKFYVRLLRDEETVVEYYRADPMIPEQELIISFCGVSADTLEIFKIDEKFGFPLEFTEIIVEGYYPDDEVCAPNHPDMVNLALSQPVFLSPVHGARLFASEHAVDGDLTTQARAYTLAEYSELKVELP